MPVHDDDFKKKTYCRYPALWAATLVLILTVTTPHGATAADTRQNALQSLSQLSAGVAEVARTVTPAVVNISSTRIIKQKGEAASDPFFNDPFFRQFFGDQFFKQQLPPRERREQSLGSGVIVSANGYILTNNHVVEHASEIKVLMSDKREYSGKLIGTDPKTDVAVLKIEATGLPAVPWGDSDKLQVGEYAIAIGNPFGLNQTVTMGIISAVGRANVGIADYEDFIQTDAAINPGNSGGALVNVKGELIGINTAIFSQSGGYMGIGFAIPSNMVRAVMDSLIKSGKVVRGWLGVSVQEITPELAKQFGLSSTKGVLVTEAEAGSPAARGGLTRGDVITSFDGKAVTDSAHLRNQVAGTRVGKKVPVTLLRDKKELSLEVTIVELPAKVAKSQKEREATESVLAGIEVQDLTARLRKELDIPKDLNGVIISDVRQGSSGEAAGLQEGDLIEEVNRQPVRNFVDYTKATRKVKVGENVLLLVFREGTHLFVTVTP